MSILAEQAAIWQQCDSKTNDPFESTNYENSNKIRNKRKMLKVLILKTNQKAVLRSRSRLEPPLLGF